MACLAQPIHIRITAPEVAAKASVRLDGREIGHHLKRLEVVCEAGNLTEVRLTLVGVKLDLDGKAFIRSDDVKLIADWTEKETA